MTYQQAIIIFLPVLTPLIGSSIAAILAQDHWHGAINDGIAWVVLLAVAALDMWANGQFSGGWVMVVADLVQIVSLLSSGWLIKLTPWLIWLSWLQSNVFNIVPLLKSIEERGK